MQCVPLFSRILSLFAESNDLQFAVPGGLIGVGTMIDPTLTRADRLVGQVLGSVWLGLGLTLTLTLALTLTLTLTRRAITGRERARCCCGGRARAR